MFHSDKTCVRVSLRRYRYNAVISLFENGWFFTFILGVVKNIFCFSRNGHFSRGRLRSDSDNSILLFFYRLHFGEFLIFYKLALVVNNSLFAVDDHLLEGGLRFADDAFRFYDFSGFQRIVIDDLGLEGNLARKFFRYFLLVFRAGNELRLDGLFFLYTILVYIIDLDVDIKIFSTLDISLFWYSCSNYTCIFINCNIIPNITCTVLIGPGNEFIGKGFVFLRIFRYGVRSAR